MQWGDWLKQKKQQANNDCLLILSRNHNYQNLCIGWRNTNVSFPSSEIIPSDVVNPDIAAWEYAIYDKAELAAKSGIHQTEGQAGLLKKAAAIGMIYPDGTISEAASKLLAAIIAKEVKQAVKQPTPN